MLFENLKVGRVVMHEIFQRNDDKSIKSPIFADALETLSGEALGAFRLRLTEALSGQSQSLEMKIVRHEAGSFLDLAESLVGSIDQSFLFGSRKIANKLAEAQLARLIPGGMMIMFDGTHGSAAIPFIGVIKAETQAGFRRSLQGTKTVTEFLQKIFLTPATRLYKIGLMTFGHGDTPRPDGRRAFVFDSNISSSNREAAAAYFYEAFLGCAFPNDGPYETARFFDLTKQFVRSSELDPEKKRDIIDSLYVFVRDEQSPTFTADQFGSRYLPPPLQDTYAEFLDTKKFTTDAVVRDTSQMGTRLRRRRFKFGADIELSASPEALKNKITIKPLTVNSDDGTQSHWTQIVIQEPMTAEK